MLTNLYPSIISVGSSIIRRYGDTDFVTGLRCDAILMVLLVHTGAFSEFGAIGQSVTDNGKFGVQIFFVIAGFTIYQNVSTSDYNQYLIRRIFRVVPVYYFFILVGFCLLWFDVLQLPSLELSGRYQSKYFGMCFCR